MTKCPIIPFKTDRLAQPNRPKSPVRSGPENRASHLQPRSNPRQPLRWNGEATACNPFNHPRNGPEAATDPTGNALSP